MFNLFKKKLPSPEINNLPVRQAGQQSTTLKLSGLDCASCAIDIDLTLEDTPGVISAKTNYAKSELNISFDPKKTTIKEINKTLTSLGYLK